MALKDLFGKKRKESLLSVKTLLDIYNLPVVTDIYHNQLLDLKSDDRVEDITNSFREAFKSAQTTLDIENFLFYFHQEGSVLNLTISYCHALAVNEAVFEQIHYYFDLSTQNIDEVVVLVGYQENSNENKAPIYLNQKSKLYKEKAFPWFVFMHDYLLLLNDYIKFDDKLSELIIQGVEDAAIDDEDSDTDYEDDDIDDGEDEVMIWDREYHLKHIFYQGISFRVVGPKEGLDLLKSIHSVNIGSGLLFEYDSFRFRDENGFFLVADEDVETDLLNIQYDIEGHNIRALAFIFLGNLKVTKALLCEDIDFSPNLVVMKDLYAKNSYICGNTHYIGGDVKGEVLYGKYNDACLHINGTLLVSCIVVHQMVCYINKVNAGIIISDNDVYGIDLLKDEQGLPLFHLNLYPSTHRVREVFIKEVGMEDHFGKLFPSENDLISCFLAGKSVLKKPLKNNYGTFTKTINKRFDTLFDLIGTDSLKIEDGPYSEYFYTIFEYKKKNYREVGRFDELGHYQVRILHCIEDNSYEAMVEFYQDDNETFISAFKSGMSDNFTSTNTAKCTFNIAEELILKKFK